MNTRFRLFFILLGALLVVATFTFPRWQPLIGRQGADLPVEVLGGMSPALQPTFAALPPEQQDAYRRRAEQNPQAALAMINAALAAPTTVPDLEQALPNMTGPVEIASGDFTRIDGVRWATGSLIIYQQTGNSKILRFENFSMVNGPNLRVILSTLGVPLPENPALSPDDIDLGALRGNLGSQNYEIAAEVDLPRYNSIIIYSRALNLIYSIAPLLMS